MTPTIMHTKLEQINKKYTNYYLTYSMDIDIKEDNNDNTNYNKDNDAYSAPLQSLLISELAEYNTTTAESNNIIFNKPILCVLIHVLLAVLCFKLHLNQYNRLILLSFIIGNKLIISLVVAFACWHIHMILFYLNMMLLYHIQLILMIIMVVMVLNLHRYLYYNWCYHYYPV